MNSYTLASLNIDSVTWQQARPSLRLIRERVFIHEQAVPVALEWDGLDEEAIHILATTTENEPVATARMLADGHIGRMAVLKDWRHQGIGSAMLLELVAIAQQQGLPRVELDAQTHAISFYQKHGFVACSDVFMDAGIPHRKMHRLLD